MAGIEADDVVLGRLEDATRDAVRLQSDTLRAILGRNGACGYLRRHLLLRQPPGGGAVSQVDAESFRRYVPLSSYEDYAGYIQSMAEGAADPSELSFDPLLCFFSSSGTTSTGPKMIPFFDSPAARDASALAHQASSALLRRSIPPRPAINKILWFLYAGDVKETGGGFKVMAATAFPFQRRIPSSSPLSLCVSPQPVIMGTDTRQQTYCHLLCGLSNRGLIDGVRAPYAAGLIRAIRLLKSKWEQLCEDIEHGTVHPAEITDPAMRDAVQSSLAGARPELADGIRRICGRGSWGGILGELWAEARYIACVTTGSMEQYYHLLKFYAGSSLPVLCGDYFASECLVGVNMGREEPPGETSFVIFPGAAYFEFLPFEIGTTPSAAELVDITGVEVGKMYEVVATTHRGLYRYRLGDVVEVVGFHNASPRVAFVTRAPKGWSEPFTERELMSAVEGLGAVLRGSGGGGVLEFAGLLDSESSAEHALIFLEMEKPWASDARELELLRRGCALLEGSLGSVYRAKRERGDLGPLEVAVVRAGSFEDLASVAAENGAPANQFKPPKILRNPGHIKLLKASVVAGLRMASSEEH